MFGFINVVIIVVWSKGEWSTGCHRAVGEGGKGEREGQCGES